MAQPAGNAHTRWGERDGLLLCLGDEQGLVGIGEASPLPGYSADNLATCGDRLQKVPWGDLALELSESDGRLSFTAPTEQQLAALPAAARCAAETALLDLIAQHRAVPLATLLRAGTPPAAVAVSALLTGENPAELLASAHAAVARGFRVLKVKVGRPDGAAWELAALRELRRQLAPNITLRLDANRAWTLAEATERLAALAEIEPELIEEPLAQVNELRHLKTPLRIALDESLQHLDAESAVVPLLATGAVRALVLKPMALGGPLRCLQLARLAATYAAPCLVTHLFDGPVALAAAAAVALALPLPLACGLDAHPGLALGPSVYPDFVGAPQIRVPTQPGLGIALTTQQLAPLVGSRLSQP
jgi:o-succinylbenzoate synthase